MILQQNEGKTKQKRNMMEMMRVVLIFAVSMMILTKAQDTTCLSQLAPCLNYLNGTKDVPDVCCNPLKSVIRNNPKCLCSMISSKESSRAERAGIDVNEAQMLPARCGEHVNPLSCLSGSGRSRNSDGNSSSAGFLLHSNWVILVMAYLIVQISWTIPC